MVKQSTALNRPGAENLKPRQLSDAIHQEVGEKVMSQISDGLWEIIRSGDGIKSEITETVQSVYNELLNPKGKEDGESCSHSDATPIRRGPDNNGSVTASASEIEDKFSDSEPQEPPGFSLHNLHQNNHHEDQPKEQWLPTPHDGLPTEAQEEEPDVSAPPGFSVVIEHKQLFDGGGEDPDVPPGFG